MALTFIIATLFAVPAVSADSRSVNEEILESKTELGKLYAEINPSVVYISVKSVKSQSARNALPLDQFQDLIPFIQEFFNSPNENRDQQSEPTEEQYSYGSGTGFVWDDQGHIVTNYHVIEGAVEVRVTYHDGIVRNATIIGEDPDSDLAVLAVEDFEAGLIPLTVGDSDQLTQRWVAPSSRKPSSPPQKWG